ncbi:hypothetical protein A5750_22890 [Mycobacterium sp. 852002-51613_SCH5001154]|uniref:hypothetical protein n=1 Tax=Mycobacterium sp. 852002-51613_SCH5001154 TaxID=1834104 RepID=UPI0007FCED0C|nr:hypothetical protein [Mycobacterium sp. 852002-51613_SCH5001154]OBF70429.1 hypothetical protein A5750_22890 [Mycobacterium sp. 852002-51613_SCH5001154]
MSRIHDVIRRYDACSAVLKNGVEILSVGDPAGAQLNAAVRRILFHVDDDNRDVWEDLIRAANAVRWRRMTQPQPNAFNPALGDAITAVVRQGKLLHGFVSDNWLVEKVVDATAAVSETDSPVGAELLRSITDVGTDSCVVVASTGSARAGIDGWLQQFGIKVVVAAELDELGAQIEQAFVVGPPAFFSPSVVTAPATKAISFVMPAWFRNHTVPTSSLASQAEGGIAIGAKVFTIGDVAEPPLEVSETAEVEDTYYPQFVWGTRKSEDREPESDEVEAWKILLAGGLALWLDDGERIRSLDPRQPEGDLVSYEAVDDVQPGTYLVLREGATEHGAMYEAALASVGSRAAGIVATQAQWKKALADRLEQDGAKRLIEELKKRNISSATRVRAWTEPTLICPRQEEALAALLESLGIPLQPTYGNALRLRRALYQASADLRQELETAVGMADLNALQREGLMRLELQREGFRGMIVARVLARAPFTEIVLRRQTRVPLPDKDAQWLE